MSEQSNLDKRDFGHTAPPSSLKYVSRRVEALGRRSPTTFRTMPPIIATTAASDVCQTGATTPSTTDTLYNPEGGQNVTTDDTRYSFQLDFSNSHLTSSGGSGGLASGLFSTKPPATKSPPAKTAPPPPPLNSNKTVSLFSMASDVFETKEYSLTASNNYAPVVEENPQTPVESLVPPENHNDLINEAVLADQSGRTPTYPRCSLQSISMMDNEDQFMTHTSTFVKSYKNESEHINPFEGIVFDSQSYYTTGDEDYSQLNETNIIYCGFCGKKLNLTSFKCKCQRYFCEKHRHAESHKCVFDYKNFKKDVLKKSVSSSLATKKLRKV